MEDRLVLHFEPSGQRVSHFGVARDITARKQTEEALRAKNEEVTQVSQQLWQATKLATLGELAASVAHELNNPLATVSLRVESLLAQLPAEDPKRRALEVVEQEVERMAGLVASLPQFSRRSPPQVSMLEVRGEIGKTLDLIHYQLHNHRITVVQEFASDVPLIQADRQQLRQLLLNLFSNASGAMPRGRTLTIRVSAAVQGVMIEVADTGVGIAPADLPRLTEPFFSTKPEGKGTGLGLVICRRIVQEHGGTLNLASDGPGKGARVRVILPGQNGPNATAL